MKKIILNIFLAAITLSLLNACIKDKYDGPDTGCVIDKPTEAEPISIKDLLDNYSGLIDSALYIEGTVIADDESGNTYKKLIVQDSTAGIAINIDRNQFYATYPIGRNVYVKLEDLYIDFYGEIQGNAAGDRILNAKIDEHIKRGACFQEKSPEIVALSDLGPSYVNKLVTILGVEFENAPAGITYADAVGQTTVNLTVVDCSGNDILVRTSGFAKFAGDTVATGNGSITGYFNIFNSDYQIFIRDTDDVNMTETRCDGSTGGGGGGSGGGGAGAEYHYKDFDDNSLTSGGWTSFQESGSVNWEVGNFNSFYYGNISNYDFNTTSNSACEAWLISPALDLSTATTPVLNFRNAYKYNGDPLELFVSTDYSGGNPTAATWTALTYVASPGNFDWTDSDNVLLTAYQTAGTYIAFKYTGSNSDGSNWEVDEIKVGELQ